ncbi:hypothetical protein GCM10020001_000090 [Nonomuraea salmonea]
MQLDAVERLEEAVLQGRGQRLAAAHDRAQPGAAREFRFPQEHLQQGRDEVRDAHPGSPHQPGEVGGVAVPAGTGDDEGGAHHQWPEHLPQRHVEPGRRLLQHPIVPGEPQPLLHPGQPVHRRLVRDHHALGDAGRAGGVHDVGRVRGQRLAPFAEPERLAGQLREPRPQDGVVQGQAGRAGGRRAA